jgi:uncharacterized protein (DUF2126 family)
MVDVALAPRLVALTFALALVAGCDSGGAAADIHSYVDSSGRSCTVDANDISGTATCNVNASTVVTCASGTDPVFTTNDDYDFMTHIWTLQSCGGCIDRPNHTTNIQASSCAEITCMTNADCIHSSYMCTSGTCHHT